MTEEMKRENEQIAQLRKELKGRAIVVKTPAGEENEYTIDRIYQGINLGAKHQHLTLCRMWGKREWDIAELTIEQATALVRDGRLVEGNTLILK